MKATRVLLIISAFIVLLPSCRSALELSSQRQQGPVEVNGQMTDWEKSAPPLQLESGIIFSACNDDENLYILFSPGWNYQRQVHLLARLTMWLDAAGKGAPSVGLVYESSYFPAGAGEIKPGDGPPVDLAAMRESIAAKRGLEFLARLVEARGQIKVIDHRSRRQTVIPADGSQGPRVLFSSAWGDYTYRWRIPLHPGANSGAFPFSAKLGQTVRVRITWEPEKLFKPQRSMPSDIPGMPLPPMPSRGRLSSMPLREDGFQEGMPRKRTAWFKVTLAEASGMKG